MGSHAHTEIALTLSQIKHLKPASPLFWIILFFSSVQKSYQQSLWCHSFPTCQLNPSRHATPKCSQFRGLQCQPPSCCKAFPCKASHLLNIYFLDLLTFSAVAPCCLRPHPTTKQSLNRQGLGLWSPWWADPDLGDKRHFQPPTLRHLHPYSSWSFLMVSTSITGHRILKLCTSQCDNAR